jgi:serine/threonine protein kinase
MTTTTTIAGRYRLTGELGRGGMGVVWEAYDELLRRDVAVKEVRFPPDVSVEDRERLAERTLLEARAVAAIDTAAAVRVFDIVEQDGRPWIVMELVRGRTLTELLGEHQALDSAEVARIGLCLLEALEVAHRAGVVHRDVKPSNVIVGPDGRIALTDFGIATVDGESGDTTTGVVVGSPPYLAPERVHGGVPTPESDLWSLGATLWTAAEGRPPFRGASSFAVLDAIVHDEPPVCHRCTGALADLLLRLMDRDPAERPGYAEIREVLEEVARESRQGQAWPLEPYPTESMSGPMSGPLQESFDRTTVLGVPAASSGDGKAGPDTPLAAVARSDSRTWPLVVAFAVVLLVTAGVLAAVLRTGSGGAPSDSAGSKNRPSQQATGSTSLPQGWHRYTDPGVGWSVGLPSGWEPVTSADGIRFTDPAGGRYLQVATRYPAGSSAVGAWQDYESSFAAAHSDYRRVELTTISVPGYRDAADWEFSYVDGGADLHAVDHALVKGNRGYALFFQTHADRWDASQQLRERIFATFRPTH